MNKWWKYIAEGKNANPPRKSVAGVKRSVGALTQTGPHTGGSPYKTVKDSMPEKEKEDEMSAPPGAPGGGSVGNPGPAALEEEVEPESFEKHDELDPTFWNDNKQLHAKMKKRLMKIAVDFIDGLGSTIPLELVDVRLTGSLANYNWSKYSDVDLHIVVDFDKIDEYTDLVREYLDHARWRWNINHDIIIRGHEVEIYVENVGHTTHASGIYSLIKDEWVIKPDPAKTQFDYVAARKKADAIETEINLISTIGEREDPRATLSSAERLLNKIHRMRMAGLHSPAQEYSCENIAFKILRREEALDKLKELKYDAYDKILSMEDLY